MNSAARSPDTLEVVWAKVALTDKAEIDELIDQATATRNPFDKKYSKVEDAAWEACASVLNPISVRELMETGGVETDFRPQPFSAPIC